MLASAKQSGIAAALQHYGVKEAAVGNILRRAGRMGMDWGVRPMIGHPEKLLQGKELFTHPDSMMHPKNLFWPSRGREKANWMGRAFGTIIPAYGLYQAIKNPDPNKGTLTNALGGLGEAVGGAYGYPLGGMLGGPLVAKAGRGLGEGLGNLLGSKPSAPPPPPLPPEAMQGNYQP